MMSSLIFFSSGSLCLGCSATFGGLAFSVVVDPAKSVSLTHWRRLSSLLHARYEPVFLSIIFEKSPQLSSILHVHDFQEVQSFVLLQQHLVYVEIQAQHRPSRLKKPSTESVRDRSVRPSAESVGTDRIRRFCTENRMTRGKVFRKEYILELV